MTSLRGGGTDALTLYFKYFVPGGRRVYTFNACTFENIYKIEDELYNISENDVKLIFNIIE